MRKRGLHHGTARRPAEVERRKQAAAAHLAQAHFVPTYLSQAA